MHRPPKFGMMWDRPPKFGVMFDALSIEQLSAAEREAKAKGLELRAFKLEESSLTLPRREGSPGDAPRYMDRPGGGALAAMLLAAIGPRNPLLTFA